MKTLDEVIKANECCDHGEMDSRCEDCPYSGIGACCAERETDALHYLREYQKLGSIDAIAFTEDADDNPPLTWDELKQMEGKPVWLEDHFQNDVKTWCIVKRIVKDEDCEYIIFDGIYFPKNYFGEKIDGWQAYKKERE